MMNELDKIFRNKLNHYSADVPDSVWENIEQSLQNQERNPIPNVWLIASTLTTVAVISVLSLFAADHLSFKNNNINHQLPLENIEQHVSTIPDQSVAALSEDIKEYSSGFEKAKNNIQPDIRISEIGNINQTALTSKNESYVNRIIPGDYHANKTASNLDVSTEITDQSMEMAATDAFKAIDQIHALPAIDGIPNLYSGKIQKIQIAGIRTEPVKACPFNVNYKDKSLDIYFSSDYIDKQLTDREGGEKLKDMRTTTESPMYSFSAGIRLGYNIGYRWNIHTGLNYSQINEKFEYRDPESSTVRIVIVKDYIYENGQVVDSIVKQEEVIVPGTTELAIYNKFRTFDLPVLGRYTILANNYFSLSAVGGIYINISSFEKGTIISDATHKPVQLSRSGDESSIVYKNQLGISFYGAFSIAYHMTANTDLLVEPYARIHPESITVSTYPLYQKFNRYGLNLGLRYKF